MAEFVEFTEVPVFIEFAELTEFTEIVEFAAFTGYYQKIIRYFEELQKERVLLGNGKRELSHCN